MSFSRTLKERVLPTWEDCYNHPFVQQLGSGELEKEAFIFYLKQDYKYLLEYARVFALGALRASDGETARKFTFSQKAVFEEMNLHISYMESFGISPAEAESTAPSLFNRAYTTNMMAVGYNEGIAGLMSALLPCAWTYYDFACRLKEDFKDKLEGNYYKSWIETYSSEEFLNSFSWFFETMDKLCEGKSESELERIVDIFRSSIEFEFLFWDMAYKKQMSYK